MSQAVAHGRFRQNMSWTSEALCAGLDTEQYFDKYENDVTIANKVDELCLGCPVMQQCFDYGVSTESWGVWGGVFLVDGKIDNARNSHKDVNVWSQISRKMERW